MQSAGSRLRHLLEDAGLSQVAAAQLLDCSQKHLNQVLQGKARLSVELAVSCQRVLRRQYIAKELLTLQLAEDLSRHGL